jgi:hypothetical protein
MEEPLPTPSQLATLRKWAAKAKALQLELEDLEERSAEAKRDLDQITKNDLLNLLNEYGIPELTLAPEGNEPGFEFSIKQVISANIPKHPSDVWPEERRQKAFDLLPDDIVYTNVVVIFAKGEVELAVELYNKLVKSKKKYTVVIDQSVNHSTLKSWIKHQLEEGGKLPALDDIGALIFNEVKIKEVKR